MSQPTPSNNRVACLVGCLRHRRVLAHTRLRTAKQSASTLHQRTGPSAVASTSGSEVRKPLQVAHNWVRDVLSGRRINDGDRTQMYDLVHNQIPRIPDPSRLNALWRAFEDCVNLGIVQLLETSPSFIRGLYSRLDAIAHFHEYAQVEGLSRPRERARRRPSGRPRSSAA